MIQIFANRTELMPVGETTEEHKQWQDEEAALVERDRSSGVGLFRGCFRMLTRRPITLAAPIRDDEDNVDRCPRCTWELEDGQCGSCGYHVEDAGSSGSEGAEYYHPDEMYDMEHAVDMDDALLETLVEEANADEFYGEQHDSDAEDDDYSPPSYIRHRELNVLHRRLPSNDYDSLPDTEEGSGDEEEVDSLDSFVVADEEQPPSTASSNRSASHSTTSSSRSLNWETENRTAIGGIQESDDDHESQQNSEASEHEASSPISLFNHRDESDEGPVPPSRRQVFRFSSDSDESASTEFSQAVGTIIQDRAHRRRSPGTVRGAARHPRNIPHRASERGHSNGTPRTTQMESDSEPSVPTQRRRRKRAIQSRLSSSDETNAAGSGTVTVGHQSPRIGPSVQTVQRPQASQARNTTSPTVTALSSTRSANTEDEEPNQPLVPAVVPPLEHFSNRPQSALLAISPRAPRESYERTRRPPTDANRGTYSSPQNHLTLDHSTYPGQPSTNQQRRRNHLYGLPQPRHGRTSPAVRLSHSPMRSDGRPGRSARDRRAQKLEKRAERERLKAERELRSSP